MDPGEALWIAAEERDPLPFLAFFDLEAELDGLAGGTRRSYRAALERFLHYLWEEEGVVWDPRAPERWLTRLLKAGVRPNTVRVYLQGLRYLMPRLARVGGPQALVPRMFHPREHAVLDDAVYHKALGLLAGDGPRAVVGRLILRLLGQEGLRPHELFYLEAGDVDLERGQIEARKAPQARPRHLELEPATLEDLARWLELRPGWPDRGPALILNPYGRGDWLPFTAMVQLTRATRRLLAPAGLAGLAERFPVRALRNRAALVWYRRTGSTAAAARRLGLRSRPFVLRGVVEGEDGGGA